MTRIANRGGVKLLPIEIATHYFSIGLDLIGRMFFETSSCKIGIGPQFQEILICHLILPATNIPQISYKLTLYPRRKRFSLQQLHQTETRV